MTTASIHADFLVKSPGQRGLALGIAIALTTIVLLQLSLQLPISKRLNERGRELFISWVQIKPEQAKAPVAAPPPSIKPVKLPTITASKQPPTKLIKNSKDLPTEITPLSEDKSISFDSVSESIKRDSSPISEGKRFDSRAVRQAYEDSKSDIQKRAEATGSALESQRLTKHERFQEAAKAAVKPDCLRQGGSILSLFVVAYQAATDHCK